LRLIRENQLHLYKDDNVDGYRVVYSSGYESWTPSEEFENGYITVEDEDENRHKTGDIGWAKEMMDLGKMVARSGWNGKNMYIYKVEAASYPSTNNPINSQADTEPDDMIPYKAYTAMRTVSGERVPWTCSQSDWFAEDYVMAEVK
jgi:hypothetical protein